MASTVRTALVFAQTAARACTNQAQLQPAARVVLSPGLTRTLEHLDAPAVHRDITRPFWEPPPALAAVRGLSNQAPAQQAVKAAQLGCLSPQQGRRPALDVPKGHMCPRRARHRRLLVAHVMRGATPRLGPALVCSVQRALTSRRQGLLLAKDAQRDHPRQQQGQRRRQPALCARQGHSTLSEPARVVLRGIIKRATELLRA